MARSNVGERPPGTRRTVTFTAACSHRFSITALTVWVTHR